MRFSIITVTFNAESFLKETLDSVWQQRGIEFEHIIWDGGSSDRTLEIARGFPVKIFEGRDTGIADAMNKGASFATGEILLHLHADDCLAHPNVLANVDLLFKQYPDLNWLYGLSETINESGQVLSQSKFKPFFLNRLRKYNIISHPATFIKKTLFEKYGGFDTTLKYCMDYELWLRLSRHCHPQAFPFVFSKFRQHGGSLSSKEVDAVTDEAYHVRNRYVKGFWGRWRSYCTWKKRRKSVTQKAKPYSQ